MLQTANRSQIILLHHEADRSLIILDNVNIILLDKAGHSQIISDNANIILLDKVHHSQIILLPHELDHSRIISASDRIRFLKRKTR